MIQRIWDITFSVTDLKEAVSFYEETLGLKKKYEFKDYAGFDCCGVEIGLQLGGKKEKREAMPCVNFLVDDVDAEYQALRRKGVKFIKKPEDTLWGGRIANFFDPDGNVLQFTEINWQKYFEVSSEGIRKL